MLPNVPKSSNVLNKSERMDLSNLKTFFESAINEYVENNNRLGSLIDKISNDGTEPANKSEGVGSVSSVYGYGILSDLNELKDRINFQLTVQSAHIERLYKYIG